MRTQWRFSGCNGAERRRIVNAWQEARLGLEARLNEVDTDRVDVLFAISHRDGERPWQIKGRVCLSAKPYIAHVQSDEPLVALDECVGQIVDQIACGMVTPRERVA